MVPTVAGLLIFVAGFPKLARLRASNAFARNWKFTLSVILKSFKIPASHSENPGPNTCYAASFHICNPAERLERRHWS
jgi:hypothetical protein